MNEATYLISRIQSPHTHIKVWGKFEKNQQCHWIGNLFYGVPFSAAELPQEIQAIGKDSTIGILLIESYIPLRWQVATTPVPIDQDLIDQFYDTYTSIRKQQELQGVVCIRRGEIQEKANLPTELFNHLFQHLKETHLISTYTSRVDGSEIVSWNS